MDRAAFKDLIKRARGDYSSHAISKWYETTAVAAGFRDWNTLSAKLPDTPEQICISAIDAAARLLNRPAPTIFTNPFVHRELKETRTAFLSRVRHIEYGRTNKNYGAEEGLTVYIHSPESYARWHSMQAVARRGDFQGLDQYFKVRHFAVQIGSALASWLRNNDVDLLYRQMALWLSAKDYMTPTRRGIMREQLYPPFFDLVAALKLKHFGPERDDTVEPSDEEVVALYERAWRSEFGGSPPQLLRHPYALGFRCRDEWSVAGDFDFRFPRLFLKDSDWSSSVLGSSDDPIRRAESDDGTLWRAWRHQFATYDSLQEHEYKPMAAASPDGGIVYVVEQEGTGLFKIGYTASDDAGRRVKTLQTGNGNELRLLGSFRCAGRATEAALHRRFSDRRRLGEWFALSLDDARNILDESWRAAQNIF